MEHTMITGYFSVQPNAADYEYFFKIGENNYIELTFPDGIEQALEVPVDRKIALCTLLYPNDEGKWVVCTHDEFFKVLKNG